MKTTLFSELKGQVIKEINFGLGDPDGTIKTENNNYGFHDREDFSSVRLVKIIGNLENILNEKIILAEEDSREPDWYQENYDYSHTWTAYFLESEKGRVEFWVLGESNGYYSEVMDFYKEE